MQNKDFVNNSRLEKKPAPVKDESYSDEGYDDDDGFEEDKDTGEDPMEKMRKKLKKENEKA